MFSVCKGSKIQMTKVWSLDKIHVHILRNPDKGLNFGRVFDRCVLRINISHILKSFSERYKLIPSEVKKK